MRKSRLGQNFLLDRSLARKIVEASGISEEDTVVEIGPGLGTMTRIIAGRVKRLIAIELDRNLYGKLREEFEGTANVELLNLDVLHYDFRLLEPFKVVANIPYYITTPILFKLIEEGSALRSMTLTAQREVAKRIAAGPGGKDYGVLSIMVQIFGRPRIMFHIPAGAFTPKPKVDSTVVRIDRHEVPPAGIVSLKVFRAVVRAAFAGRRKMIKNSLGAVYPGVEAALLAAGVAPQRRPETVSLGEFAAIANHIAAGEGNGAE